MASDGSDDDANRPKPAQIPLLDDVVEPGRTRRPRVRREKNLDLPLDPDPPVIRDLFSTPEEDDLVVDPEEVPPAPTADITDMAVPETAPGVADNTEAAMENEPGDFSPEAHEATGASNEGILRERAAEIVDGLVAEYSRELVQRLRDELTHLLEELEEAPDQPAAKKAQSDPDAGV